MLQSSENEPMKYLEERFGIEEEDLKGLKLVQRSGDYWLASKESEEAEVEFETEGIRFLRVTGRGLKPTTYGLQLMNDRLEKNVVELEKQELLKLLRREEMIPLEMEEDGYVALKYKDQIIGCGMYKHGVVSSRVPKGRSSELEKII